MRRVIALLLVLALAGCSGDDAKSNPATTTAPTDPGTTNEFVVPSTTAELATTTTVAATSDDNPGSESIAVTEKITITVTDPED